MKALTNARRLWRLFESPIRLNSDRLVAREASISLLQWRDQSSSLFKSPSSSLLSGYGSEIGKLSMYTRTFSRADFSSEATEVEESKPTGISSEATKVEESKPTEAVKEIYDKIIESVTVKKTMSPNAWLWSMIEKCENTDDITLLFELLRKLRRFRLSKLRIYENFNLNLCREVTKACVRVKALDYGMLALRKHNLYGLTPTVFGVNELLRYARDNKNARLMMQVMKLATRNDLPLQPTMADLVFCTCYNTNKWNLMVKYSKKFLQDDVKLRKTALNAWTEFATKVGDTETLETIEKLKAALPKDQVLET